MTNAAQATLFCGSKPAKTCLPMAQCRGWHTDLQTRCFALPSAGLPHLATRLARLIWQQPVAELRYHYENDKKRSNSVYRDSHFSHRWVSRVSCRWLPAYCGGLQLAGQALPGRFLMGVSRFFGIKPTEKLPAAGAGAKRQANL